MMWYFIINFIIIIIIKSKHIFGKDSVVQKMYI